MRNIILAAVMIMSLSSCSKDELPKDPNDPCSYQTEQEFLQSGYYDPYIDGTLEGCPTWQQKK
jgi:hypothetical protein